MKIGRFAILGLAVALLCGAGAATAKADSYEYTITGPSGGFVASFVIPTTFTGNSNDIVINNVNWSFNGVAQGETEFDLFSTALGGGLSLGPGGSDISASGAQLFTGGLPNPTLLTGDFTLTGANGLYDVNVTDPVNGPETSTLMMLGVGLFALAGIALYQRRTVAATLAS